MRVIFALVLLLASAAAQSGPGLTFSDVATYDGNKSSHSPSVTLSEHALNEILKAQLAVSAAQHKVDEMQANWWKLQAEEAAMQRDFPAATNQVTEKQRALQQVIDDSYKAAEKK